MTPEDVLKSKIDALQALNEVANAKITIDQHSPLSVDDQRDMIQKGQLDSELDALRLEFQIRDDGA
jgi:hypothetical protein